MLKTGLNLRFIYLLTYFYSYNECLNAINKSCEDVVSIFTLK